jgi:hypothetical protein
MLENTTKEKSIEIAVRLYENNAYGTTFGKGMYRRALFNGTIDARTPSAKYLVDCFNYADWSNQATTDEQMAVLAAVKADDKKLYSWIKHYDTVTRAKRLVSGCMQLDMESLDMNIMICDEAAGVADHWQIEGKPCKTTMKSQKSPQILGTNADLTNW